MSHGGTIPTLGLGVYQAERGDETKNAVIGALRAGYRHIDTARIYGNERDVGEGIRESGVPRSEIFVTTKLWNADQGFDQTLKAYDASVGRLGFDQVDLYLIHWPVPKKRLESWKALERLLAEKRVRAIGVSNFMVHHLEELVANTEVPPAVNQIELSPFLQQREVRAFCAAKNIVVEAYSPLTRGERLTHPVVKWIADDLRKTSAQILIRWALQKGLVVLPKSVRNTRIAENAAVFDFEIGDAAMAKLDSLEEGLVTGWDPREAP